jgi:hypothetical protein
MKTFHGFSPLSVAALFVAALAFPVVLFPFGGVLLANVIYAYGYAEYKDLRKTSIFDIFVYISGLANVVLISLFLWLPTEDFYQLIRSFAFIGGVILATVPDGTPGILFVINILVFVLCLNPLLVTNSKSSAIYGVDYIRVYIPNRPLFLLQAGYAFLPFLCGLFGLFLMIYLFEIPRSMQHRARIEWEWLEIIFIPVTIFTCYFRMLRTSALEELERKI